MANPAPKKKTVVPPPLRSKPAPETEVPKEDEASPKVTPKAKSVNTSDLEEEDAAVEKGSVTTKPGEGTVSSPKPKVPEKSPVKTPRKRSAPSGGTPPKPRKKPTRGRASKQKPKFQESSDEYEEDD